MDLLTATFTTLMAMTPSKYDTESSPDRETRMHVIALAINDATRRAACIDEPADCKLVLSDRRLGTALLLGKGSFETHFAEYVHAGRCTEGPKDARCDSDSHGVPRAHGPWQQWRLSVFPQTDWDAMNASTLESTKISAWHALTLLAGSLRGCTTQYPNEPVAGAIARFAGTCLTMKPEKVRREAHLVEKIWASLPTDKPES